MKNLLITGIAVTAFCGVPALAAPPVAPIFNWTGCYIGANTGDVWADKHIVTTRINAAPTSFDRGSWTTNGWAYGGQVGCDYQLNNWVVGIRGMWDGPKIRGDHALNPSEFGAGEADHLRFGPFATAVAKFGYLLNPTLELYGLAGVAWVRDRYSTTFPGFGETNFGYQNRNGYDVGVGLSWMFARNWDVWVEYDYMGFGTKNVVFIGEGGSAGNNFYADVKQGMSKVLVGINYRFR